MPNRHAESASDSLGINTASDDILVSSRLIGRRHCLAKEVFRQADLAGGRVLVLAETNVDRVILGKDAPPDQQADSAPTAPTSMDVVKGLFGPRRADDEGLQKPMFGNARSQCLKASVAIGLANITLGQAQLGVRNRGGLHEGSPDQYRGPDHGRRFRLQGASPQFFLLPSPSLVDNWGAKQTPDKALWPQPAPGLYPAGTIGGQISRRGIFTMAHQYISPLFDDAW